VGLALVIALVCLPFVEIYLAIQVSHQIGGLATILLLLLLSASGPWIVKHQGLGVWRRARARAAAGEIPGREASDGALLLTAGVLLTFPGFLTAALGILLLLPPVNAVVRAGSGWWLRRGIGRSRISVRTYTGGRWDDTSWGSRPDGDRDRTIDVSGRDLPTTRRGLEPPSDH
jgi:UPF0716 protein FxsA